MHGVLSRFARALRNADVRISPAEILDAVNALNHVDIGNRQTVYNTLTLVLAKTERDKVRFRDVFEQFFSRENSSDIAALLAQIEPTDEKVSASDEATTEIELTALAQMLNSSTLAEINMAIEQAAASVGLDEIRYFTQLPVYRRKILEQMGYEGLQKTMRELRGAGDEQQHDRLERARASLVDEVDNRVNQGFLLFGDTEGEQLRQEMLQNMNLARIDRYYQKDLQKLVQKMTEKLVSRYTQRKKRTRTGALNLRKTLRRNVAYDGHIVDLYWSKKRINHPELMVLCDISGSVSAYALFLLMFMHSIGVVVPRVRCFAFSSHLGEVTEFVQKKDFAESAKQIVKSYGLGSSDYARSFRDFNQLALKDIGRRTSVVILGDARNNFGDPETMHLRQVHERAKRVIWLNPESKVGWDSGDSVISKYSAYCTKVNVCNSLRHLERVVEDLLLND